MRNNAAAVFSDFIEQSFLSRTNKQSKAKGTKGLGMAVLAGSIALANGLYAAASEAESNVTAKSTDLTTTASIDADLEDLSTDPVEMFSDAIPFSQSGNMNIDTLFGSVIEEDNLEIASLTAPSLENDEPAEENVTGPLGSASLLSESYQSGVSDPSQPNPDILVTHEFGEFAHTDTEAGLRLDSLFGNNEAALQTDTKTESGTETKTENNTDDPNKELGDLLTLDEDFFSGTPDSDDLLIEKIGEEVEDGVVDLGDGTDENIFAQNDDLTLGLQNQEEQQNENQFDTTPDDFGTTDTGLGGFETDTSFDDSFGGLFG